MFKQIIVLIFACYVSATPTYFRLNVFDCKDGHKAPMTWFCDNIKDCANGLDELNCNYLHYCPAGQYMCKSGECLPAAMKCNREIDCMDASDERDCPQLDVHPTFPSAEDFEHALAHLEVKLNVPPITEPPPTTSEPITEESPTTSEPIDISFDKNGILYIRVGQKEKIRIAPPTVEPESSSFSWIPIILLALLLLFLVVCFVIIYFCVWPALSKRIDNLGWSGRKNTTSKDPNLH